MTTEQHDSKTEGRGEETTALLENLRAKYGDDEAKRLINQCACVLASRRPASSPQSPSEPGRGDDLARQERMAKLEREIAAIAAEHWTADNSDEKLQRRERLRSELSRLRNEGGSEELVHIRTDRGLWRPKAEGYTNDKRDAGLWVRSEAEDMTRHLGPEKSLQLIPVDASPSHLPVREAIDLARAAIRYWQRHDLLREFGDDGQVLHKNLIVSEHIDTLLAALQPLSQGNGEAVGADHKSIWLSPVCDREHCDNCRDDRTWHEDRLPICDECGAVPTQYIRADLYLAPSSQPEGVREALEEANGQLEWANERIAKNEVANLAERWAKSWNEQVPGLRGRTLAKHIEAAIMAAAPFAVRLTTTPSRGLVEAAEWQPIETAPKDETPFIGYLGWLKIPYFICWWAKASVRTGKPFICILGIGELYNVELNPTHWMPLPAPPRTLSVKPTANAADREGDRDG